MLIIKRRSWPFQTTPNLLNSVSVKYWINPDTKSKVLLSPESGRGKCSKIFYDAADAPDSLGKIMSMQQSISKWHSLCPSLVPASLCLQSTDIHWLMISTSRDPMCSTWRCACNVHKPSSRQPQRKQASPANKLDKNGKKGEEKKKKNTDSHHCVKVLRLFRFPLPGHLCSERWFHHGGCGDLRNPSTAPRL